MDDTSSEAQTLSSGKLIVKIVLWCLLGLFAAFLLTILGTMLVKKYIKKDPVPMFAGYAHLIVQTGSMHGTLEVGDLIIIKQTGEYSRGEIVTYINSNGEVVTHRIVEIDEATGTYTLWGDANPSKDQYPVYFDQIVGEWVATIPKVGIIIDWLFHEFGILYVIAIVVTICVGMYFLKLTKSDDGKKAKDDAGASECDAPKKGSANESIEYGANAPPADASSQDNKSADK